MRLDRSRLLGPDGVTEEVVVESVAHDPVDVVVHLDLGTDLAPMAQVKQGAVGERAVARGDPRPA